jgi:transposase-like protein
MKPTTVRQFFAQFPDDETCLAHLFDVRFGQGHECPKCERSAKWYPLASEKAFSCQWCGHHIHPMVDTLFEKSRTSLQTWFYVIHMFTTTRHGVSGKEIQRQTGVTYKTAWRMGQMIRQHMAEVDGDAPLGGEGEIVEIDETMVGGQRKGKRGRGAEGKTVVLGMMERDGDVMTKVVPNVRRSTLHPIIEANVAKGSDIETDELKSYAGLAAKGYDHATVNHSAGEYVSEDGTTVNSIENFWRHLKCSIRGTHTSVSPKYLERYAKEFEYRFNRRTRPASMLSELLSSFAKPDA